MLNFLPNLLIAIQAAPVDAVSTTQLSGSTQVNFGDLSFLSLIMQADIIVKTVMLILLLASIWSWAIIFDKWMLFRSLKHKTKNFEKNFWASNSLENLFEHVKGKDSHPIALIFTSAMQEWKTRNTTDISQKPHLRSSTKERIYQSMQVTINKSMETIERNLSFLATVGSSATFIGLFGTVWGIIVSFQSIAISKNTTLAVVAPGIAEALLATAFGLVVAIPAGIFYNKFASEVNRFSSTLEDFSNELGTIMSKELDHIK